MGIFVCDLGFSSAKWIYGEKKGRVTSAFRRQGDSLILGDDALVLSAASSGKTNVDGYLQAGGSGAVGRYPVGDTFIIVIDEGSEYKVRYEDEVE